MRVLDITIMYVVIAQRCSIRILPSQKNFPALLPQIIMVIRVAVPAVVLPVPEVHLPAVAGEEAVPVVQVQVVTGNIAPALEWR